MAHAPRAFVEKRKASPSLKDPGRHHAILIVEDSPVDRAIVTKVIERAGAWRTAEVANGRDAIEFLKYEKVDVVLTDMMMEEMDGLALVDALRETQPRLPVVLMTAFGNEEIALRALRQGAASYVPKRCIDRDLIDTLEEVLAASHARRRHERLQHHLDSVESSYVLDNDPSLIRALVAQFQDDLARLRWPDHDRVRIGIALEEAVVNAISHGNLEVAASMRQHGHQPYRALLEERRRLSPYKDRQLHAFGCLSRSEAVFTIHDEGPGFDTKALPDPSDASNLDKGCGRGLMLIRTFMDEVRHNPAGNEIVMTKRNPLGVGGPRGTTRRG